MHAPIFKILTVHVDHNIINKMLFHFGIFTEATNSLRLSKLVVPSIKFRGDSAQLECQYELNNRSVNYHHHQGGGGGRNNAYNKFEHESSGSNTRHNYRRNNYLYYDNDEDMDETLYSVKWYKDEEEFYRYVPRANPPQNSYNFDGIKVDVSSEPWMLWKFYEFTWIIKLNIFLLSTPSLATPPLVILNENYTAQAKQ